MILRILLVFSVLELDGYILGFCVLKYRIEGRYKDRSRNKSSLLRNSIFLGGRERVGVRGGLEV